MSRQKKSKARDKITLKNTREGLIEQNAVTGEEKRVSKREIRLDLRGGSPERETYSKLGNSSNNAKSRKNPAYRQHKSAREPDSAAPQAASPLYEVSKTDSPLKHTHETAAVTAQNDTEHTADTHEAARPQSADALNAPRTPAKLPGIKPKQQRRQSYNAEPQSQTPENASIQENTAARQDAPTVSAPRAAEPGAGDIPGVKPDVPITPDSHVATDLEPSATAKLQDKHEDRLKTDKSGKLQFSQEESAPNAAKKKPPAANRKIAKAERGVERTGEKLEKARNNLPTKRNIRSMRVFDEKSGRAKRKLYLEKEVKTQGQHLKGALPLRPVKAGANAAIGYGHRKLYQVEHENVGTEAAHKSEIFAEGAVRSALRFGKTAPYRKITKLENKAAKKSMKLSYQKALAENPKLKSSVFSRMAQKRKIKKEYAKAAREAQKAAKRVQKAGSITARAAKAIAGFVRRHPIASAVIVLLALLLFTFMSMFGLASGIGNSGLGGILAASYLAEDKDIDDAELSYSEWETDLQMQINNAESDHPGYDEYRYDVGDISHNPFELMAYLTARYNDFTYAAVESDLRQIFAAQYQLSFVEEIEVRYRTETHTDPDTGEDYDVEVPYNWYILNVNLTSQSFSDVIAPRIDAEQRERYGLLMETHGNRQYILNPFDFDWLPYVTSYYGWRVHPITGVKDYHKGIDIAVPTGTPILAGHDGVVTAAAFDADGFGWYIAIGRTDGIVSKYAHCDALLASVGQEVKQGDVIAQSGNSGNSTGPHLHLEVLKNGQYLNPLFFAEGATGGAPPGTPGGIIIPDYPGEPMGDGSFAALMEEAQKHLGKPYVFGASGPNTFDCSGFVCYVLNKSGVASVGRTTATGLFHMSTPVSPANARPGDLIFFHSTYSTPNACSHIGIYIGNGMMIHAGNPVQYASINDSYWQEHFYAFGRLS